MAVKMGGEALSALDQEGEGGLGKSQRFGC